jgi:hypothetical protein
MHDASAPPETELLVQDAPAPRRNSRQTTSSGLLLSRALNRVTERELALAMRVPLTRLHSFVTGDEGMTLPEQDALAVAVLSLCPNERDLQRRAAALRGQVRAASEFSAGVTQRHSDGHPAAWRWK